MARKRVQKGRAWACDYTREGRASRAVTAAHMRLVVDRALEVTCRYHYTIASTSQETMYRFEREGRGGLYKGACCTYK